MGKSDTQSDNSLSSQAVNSDEALDVLLGKQSQELDSEEQLKSVGALFKWQLKNDAIAEAAFERTDGFIPAEEYAERLRLRREG